jgi:hypothetical protein
MGKKRKIFEAKKCRRDEELNHLAVLIREGHVKKVVVRDSQKKKVAAFHLTHCTKLALCGLILSTISVLDNSVLTGCFVEVIKGDISEEAKKKREK